MSAVRWLRGLGLGLAVLALGGAAQAGDDAGDETAGVLAAVHAAVFRGHVEKTRVLGYTLAKVPFSDVPADGAVLVGFDLGLGKFTDGDVIYALRPIYRTRRGEVAGEGYGLFADAPGKNREVLRTKVTQTVRTQARPGYAVGAVTLQTGQYIEALCVTFMRMADGALDPEQPYAGDWVGTPTDGKKESLGAGSNPIVGVFGNQDEHDVRALGLCYVKSSTRTAAAPTEPPPPPAAEPAPAKAPEDRPAKQQPEAVGSMIWIPFAAFGGMTVLFSVVYLMFTGRKEKPADGGTADAEPPPGKAVPAGPRPARPAQPAPAPGEEPPLPPELQNQSANGMALASFAIGLIALVGWCLPILGLPLTITGLVLGFKGLKSPHAGKAVAGIALNAFGLFLSVLNGVAGAYFAVVSMRGGAH